MKKSNINLALAAVAGFAKAQQIQIPNNGYWVVESNKHSPKESVVRFITLITYWFTRRILAAKR